MNSSPTLAPTSGPTRELVVETFDSWSVAAEPVAMCDCIRFETPTR